MNEPITFSFSVNLYDSDGDLLENCILAHLGNGTILTFKDTNHLENFANQILRSLDEIRASYSGC